MEIEREETLDGDAAQGWTDGPDTDDAGGVSEPEQSVDAVDALLDAVERSLTRLDDGTYGVCHTCGSTIDDGRLAAEPTAEQCGTCASDPVPVVTEAVPG